MKEVEQHENDIPAKEEIQIKSSWIQKENEYCRRKKSYRCKKSKGKKEIVSLGRSNVAFSSTRIQEILYDFFRIFKEKQRFSDCI